LPSDPIEKKPFDNTFTSAKIWSWWVKVGFIPMNRNALSHKKVRYELGEGGAPSEQLERMELLTKDYVENALELRRMGYNGQVLDAKIPVAKTAEQILDEDAQVEKLIEEKRLGSAGGLFKAGIIVANSNVVVKAAARKRAMAAEKERKKLEDKELKDQNSESSAVHIYSVWKRRGKNMKNGTPDIPAPDLKKIFDFLIPKIDPSAKLSEYSTKQKRWDKLLEFGGRGTTTWEDEMDMLIEAAGRRERENAPRLF
jgi:hypothetical protein